MDGVLVKLMIIPFEESENVQLAPPAGPPFIAQFNPETYAETTEIELTPSEPAHGDDGAEAKFKSIKPKSYTFDLTFDGTGVAPAAPPLGAAGSLDPGTGLSVVAQIELFKSTVGFSGNIHRPRFLLLVWGRLIVTCVLETFSITNKLLSPIGLPLRAVVSATFKEHRDNAVAELIKNLASPDIPHAHLVKEKEHLSTIVNGIYKTPAHYVSVAEANDLDTVRHVKPGVSLYLPPVR
jgi:hypothetical protein